MTENNAMNTIEEKVTDIVVEQFGLDRDKVHLDSKFIDDLGADSLETVELVMALEDAFNIDIPDEQAQKITTLKEAIAHIEAHLQDKISG